MTSFPDMNAADDEKMNEEIYENLKKAGLAFPETEEELSRFIELAEKSKTVVPDHLNDVTAILQKGRQQIDSTLNSSTDARVEENLAAAAREGKPISDAVSKRMDEDRRKSENKANNGHAD